MLSRDLQNIERTIGIHLSYNSQPSWIELLLGKRLLGVEGAFHPGCYPVLLFVLPTAIQLAFWAIKDKDLLYPIYN